MKTSPEMSSKTPYRNADIVAGEHNMSPGVPCMGSAAGSWSDPVDPTASFRSLQADGGSVGAAPIPVSDNRQFCGRITCSDLD